MRRVLGESTEGTLEACDIETWPLATEVKEVRIEGGELSARCPRTNNPDLYDYSIFHRGDRECESKALKMYLMKWRDVGISCAELAATLASELTGVVGSPVTVRLQQQTRGGMRLYAEAEGRQR